MNMDTQIEQRQMTKSRFDKAQGMYNLIMMFNQADSIDYEEGKNAYFKYNQMMRDVHKEYPEFGLDGIVGAFCALSPNNDYVGNLRSLITILQGLRLGTPHDKITVSTYKHCRARAIAYLQGAPFETGTRGLKTLSFYKNILYPMSDAYVTIDGHMVAAFLGDKDMKMKEALVSRSAYRLIAGVTCQLAKATGLLPSQVQAIIWFVRKRVYQIKYNPDMDMFSAPDDKWRILMPIYEVNPFPYTPDLAKQSRNRHQDMPQSLTPPLCEE